ncbi:MAG: matrixin family metalloprotease [Candidatus Melainabacteria bacterium]|nr:matrixin family metalloprotease [Candidatus Melainabacteria bacterium]
MILVKIYFLLVLLFCHFIFSSSVSAQFRSSYATQAPSQSQSGRKTTSQPVRTGGAVVYPQFKSSYGVIRWLKEQMPLKVYVSRGLSIDGFIDEELGAPVANVNNLAKWPDLVAEILESPETLQGLPVAPGFTAEHYQAATQGINMWKPFEKEGLVSFILTDDPSDADIYVFWVHHFVDKMGLALFSGDIRGYTSKRSFPYKAILAGGRADFKPVVIMLRTTESNGISMPFLKMRAACAHEFGHALGIEDHSTNPADLMSVYYGNGVISANDAATLRYLYHLTPDLIP